MIKRIAYGCFAIVLLIMAVIIGNILWSMGRLAGYW